MKIFGAIVLSGTLLFACSSTNKNQNNNTMMDTMIKELVKTINSVDLPSVQVWDKLVSFGGTEKFVPDLIEKVSVEGSGVGAVRTIFLKGGGEIIEKLTKIDESRHQMNFVILSTPMPVHNYEGIFTIRSKNKHSCIVYFESFYEVNPENKEEMSAIIKGFQETFLSNLHK